MADNTDEEHLDDLENIPSKNSPEGITPAEGTETINPNQETENMEVHHHPDLHHKPKKWKEYFLEFLMIFLAVTLGFFAENLREVIKHKEEVKSNINSLVSDLQTDISLFNLGIDRNKYSAQMSDSLIELLHLDITNTQDIYVAARTVTANLG